LTSQYPKRLIEVDLPIARISAHARREKSIRHGHISTLHIWWARRPLAACRAVICAALWPDPADEQCPPSFRVAAVAAIKAFASRIFPQRLSAEGHELQATVSKENWGRWEAIAGGTLTLSADQPADLLVLRMALLDFIADFANWDNSTVPAYLETARALTQSAHEALGGEPGTRPLVVDPFAGGGSIPLEALRVGADAFASDLNPVPVLLNKVVLEYVPKYGQRLIDEVRKWGEWINKKAEMELAKYYPNDPDGATPVAYLWARTIQCEGAACGATVPLVRSLWLSKKDNRTVALQLVPNQKAKRVDFEIFLKHRDGWVNQSNSQTVISNLQFDGTVKRGSATCPCCGYTTPVGSVRTQLKARRGGSHDAQMLAVVTTRKAEQGRFYRLPVDGDLKAVRLAAKELERRQATENLSKDESALSVVPDERISPNELRRISIPIYGMELWGDLFTPRQALALSTIARLISRDAIRECECSDPELAKAVATFLGLALSRFADICNALCMWETSKTQVRHAFTRQAIGMLWDFAEPQIFADAAGNFSVTFNTMLEVLESVAKAASVVGHVEQSSATGHPLPDDAASAIVTDPPYYDAVPYAHLSDFFYVWLRRTLSETHPGLFRESSVPKDAEIVVDRPHQLSQSNKGIAFYERELQKAFGEARRVLNPAGIGTIVFASKTTSSWEAILKAVVDSGWTITGSWPIDTEMETRVSAQGQARLASSVHLVCRPRENVDGSPVELIGEWRDVLDELPKRIHDWMPRLAAEGVVGADAIFACLGPALEVFSRYSRVEKANGDAAELREYLEHVWAVVSTEALSMIFRDADAAGLEPDARLTAMWLWTLGGSAEKSGSSGDGTADDDSDGSEEEDGSAVKNNAKASGFSLEYDAARKIAQGLGADLEKNESIVEVAGDKARLLPVAERTAYLFGKEAASAPTGNRKPKKAKQKSFFDDLTDAGFADEGWGELKGPPPGSTVLDRLHQAMILFAAGRGELMKRFLIDDGVGQDARFWKLAQSLSALYPPGTDERRWVEGVLSRKKGLGL
jgi:putative DNA methylase